MKNFYDFKIEKIKNLSSEEKNLRKKNLDLFFQNGFPNKKNEDWKFTDLNSILGKNFNNIANKNFKSEDKKLETIKNFEHKQRLVISFLKEDLSDCPKFTITNRLNWYPSGILRIRRHRWTVETYHQEGKDEGLEKYQVRNYKAIQTYIALVVLTFCLLKSTSGNKYGDSMLRWMEN